MKKIYFTMSSGILSDPLERFHDSLDTGNWSTDPKRLDDGELYQVTIEKVGVVRTTKEVEMDGE